MQTKIDSLSKLGRREASDDDNTNDAIRIINGIIEDEELCNPNEVRSSTKYIKIGMFQEDLILAKRFLDKTS